MVDSGATRRAWLAFFACALAIFAVSSVPTPPVDTRLQKIHVDWVFHVLEYGLFGWLLARAITATPGFPRGFSLALLVFAAGVCYGISDEWHQRFVPGRDSNALDAVADAVGTLGGIVYWFGKAKDKQNA